MVYFKKQYKNSCLKIVINKTINLFEIENFIHKSVILLILILLEENFETSHLLKA